MFYEFAVDPELVTFWCNKEGYKGFYSQFGIDTRRIVSQFPKNWKEHIHTAFVAAYPNPSINQKQRKTEIIEILSKRMVKRGSKNYNPTDQWLVNTEREHSERPFEGIIASNNPRKSQFVTVIQTADDLLERLPTIPSSCTAPRTPDDLVKPIAPLLRCCHHAVFVDPHFDNSPRFLDPFSKCLEKMVCERYGSGSPKVELHTSIERCFKNYKGIIDEGVEKVAALKLIKLFEECLPKIVPTGLSLRVVIWKERPRGQQLHNRYLLTDIGSVTFGTGLDCNSEAFHWTLPQGQSDDIACLSEAAHKKRWEEYIEMPAFKKVDEVTIIGNALSGGSIK
jgi:hypothetical protein